jgi:hypothetical protein
MPLYILIFSLPPQSFCIKVKSQTLIKDRKIDFCGFLDILKRFTPSIKIKLAEMPVSYPFHAQGKIERKLSASFKSN